MLDTLKDSASSRIVNVSSTAHKCGKIKFNDLNNDKTYELGEAYAQSKLANILFTKELANKLKGFVILTENKIIFEEIMQSIKHYFFMSYRNWCYSELPPLWYSTNRNNATCGNLSKPFR